MVATVTPRQTEFAKKFEDTGTAKLKAAGFRITMPRVLVLRALGTATAAIGPYAILDSILASGGRIDVVSIYRILDTFVEIGIVERVGRISKTGALYLPLDPDIDQWVIRVDNDGSAHQSEASSTVKALIDDIEEALSTEFGRILRVQVYAI